MNYKTNLGELKLGDKVFHTVNLKEGIITYLPERLDVINRAGIKVHTSTGEDTWYQNVAPFKDYIIFPLLQELSNRLGKAEKVILSISNKIDNLKDELYS